MLLKFTSDADNFIHECFGLHPAISAQFSLKMCAATKNCKKTLNVFILGFKVVQGHQS